jgi:hypothetical protein
MDPILNDGIHLIPFFGIIEDYLFRLYPIGRGSDKGQVKMIKQSTNSLRSGGKINRVLGLGFLGGIAGTLVMDALLMGILAAAGQSVLFCFTIVGSTIARLIIVLGYDISGVVPLGILTHYVIGPLVGLLYAVLVLRSTRLKTGSLRNYFLFALVFIQIFSQPLLALAPILLKLPAELTILWYGGAVIMHTILACILSLIVYYGIKRITSTAVDQESRLPAGVKSENTLSY